MNGHEFVVFISKLVEKVHILQHKHTRNSCDVGFITSTLVPQNCGRSCLIFPAARIEPAPLPTQSCTRSPHLIFVGIRVTLSYALRSAAYYGTELLIVIGFACQIPLVWLA